MDSSLPRHTREEALQKEIEQLRSQLVLQENLLDIDTAVLDQAGRKKTKRDLLRAYAELEEKMRERTRKLIEINERLTAEIRERRKAQGDLITSREKQRRITEELEVVLNGITDRIMMHDTGLHIIWANEAACSSVGLAREAIMGRRCHEVWKNRDVPCEQCPVVRAIETGMPQEGAQRSRDGSLWEIMGYPVKNENNSVRGAIEICRNVTGRKALEEELNKRYKLESLGTLAGGIAHDFNNLLTVILGNVSFAKMLLKSGDKIFSRLDDIEKASIKARDLTSQLLTFSKGGSPLKKKISLDRLLRDTVHYSLQSSDITARFRISRSLYPVEADGSQVSQVVRSIVSNALQAMPKGGTITVEAENRTGSDECMPLSGDAVYVRVCIHDTGCGMEDHVLKNIFDPFFTTKKKSAGLGLATSYSIIRKHGGHITVSSVPDKGTDVIFYLPAVPEHPAEPHEELQENLSGKGRVLFMDDEAFIRDLAGKILAHLGYEVVFAREGGEALDEYGKAVSSGLPFDAVILDLTVVDGMGGKECIGKLKSLDPGVKAIVSSGYSNDPIMAEPEKYGFSAFIAKPYNVRSLSSVLKRIVGAGDPGREITG